MSAFARNFAHRRRAAPPSIRRRARSRRCRAAARAEPRRRRLDGRRYESSSCSSPSVLRAAYDVRRWRSMRRFASALRRHSSTPISSIDRQSPSDAPARPSHLHARARHRSQLDRVEAPPPPPPPCTRRSGRGATRRATAGRWRRIAARGHQAAGRAATRTTSVGGWEAQCSPSATRRCLVGGRVAAAVAASGPRRRRPPRLLPAADRGRRRRRASHGDAQPASSGDAGLGPRCAQARAPQHVIASPPTTCRLKLWLAGSSSRRYAHSLAVPSPPSASMRRWFRRRPRRRPRRRRAARRAALAAADANDGCRGARSAASPMR